MAVIKCPACGQTTTFILSQPTYEGPFKCSYCKKLFKVSIEGPTLKTWQEITEEQLKVMQQVNAEEDKRKQEIEALKAKFRHPA